MDEQTIRIVITVGIFVVSHAAILFGGKAWGHSAQRKKNAATLQHYWDTMGEQRKELETRNQEHAELQHAHNQMRQNASMQIRGAQDLAKEAVEKLKASEQLRDQHARRVAALEEENGGLHKILKVEADKRKRSVRIDPPHHLPSPRKVKR